MGKKIFTVMLIAFVISGCGKFKGEFAFKKFFEDKYRRAEGPLEFEKNERIKWVYVFRDIRGKHNVGVALLKKELVWVDISNRSEIISETNKIIYGVIEGLSDGTYKIILTQANKVIDEKEFAIFSEHEDYYKYEGE